MLGEWSGHLESGVVRRIICRRRMVQDGKPKDAFVMRYGGRLRGSAGRGSPSRLGSQNPDPQFESLWAEIWNVPTTIVPRRVPSQLLLLEVGDAITFVYQRGDRAGRSRTAKVVKLSPRKTKSSFVLWRYSRMGNHYSANTGQHV